MTSPEVADLQDALRLLINQRVLLANDQTAARELARLLTQERATQTFGRATSKLVSNFQREQSLQASGEVDEATANALNALLKQLDPFDSEPRPRSHIVSGAALKFQSEFHLERTGEVDRGTATRINAEIRQRVPADGGLERLNEAVKRTLDQIDALDPSAKDLRPQMGRFSETLRVFTIVLDTLREIHAHDNLVGEVEEMLQRGRAVGDTSRLSRR